MTIAASFFLVLAYLEQRGQCGRSLGFAKHLVSDSCMGVHLLELFVRTFGLSKSGGFITLSRENVAKGGALLDKVPFQWRSRLTQGRQIRAEP
jgi:hypothetical protein